ncbi:putative PHD-zinc finger (C3HC4 type) protein [Neospora caninum Liverpool]|uniref:Putative PHD-zinc finger (C3HC4 type) protein n=1 Tax=Neospora caninum (strain Liverpool) TaxID=572307 RepID=F0VAT8_NEOCL|nr:putative PHD-zinc finger (C3HC4 type) protein [Neospora caninum Liverpool]CBZ51346.1 putative PHD-zinc finger (C3HC4 type) protein [Neospora caninum Liverpool]|eukprot:XP_003881379.1 putative PHD-zinc finger (C3HC4 type) protein [Neospora caninum Liverpool]
MATSQPPARNKPAAKKRLTKHYVMTEVFPEVVPRSRLHLDLACGVCLGEFQDDHCSEGHHTSHDTTATKPSPSEVLIEISESPVEELSLGDPSSSRYPSSSSTSLRPERNPSRLPPPARSSRGLLSYSPPSLLPLGLISGCTHVFHHFCIEKWGCTRENSCPQCKSRFSWLARYSRTGERQTLVPVRKRDQKNTQLEEDSSDDLIALVENVYGSGKCPACGQNVHNDDNILVCEDQFCGERYHRACCILFPSRVDHSGPWICPLCRESGRPCIDEEGRRIPRHQIMENGFVDSRRRLRRRPQRRQGRSSVSSRRERRSRSATSRRALSLRELSESDFPDGPTSDRANVRELEETQSLQSRRDDTRANNRVVTAQTLGGDEKPPLTDRSDAAAAAAGQETTGEKVTTGGNKDNARFGEGVGTALYQRGGAPVSYRSGSASEDGGRRATRKSNRDGEPAQGPQKAGTPQGDDTSVHWLEDILNWGDSIQQRALTLEKHLTRLVEMGWEYSRCPGPSDCLNTTVGQPATLAPSSPNEDRDEEAVRKESVSGCGVATGSPEPVPGLPWRPPPRRRIPINTEMLTCGAFRPKRQIHFPGPSSVLLARRRQFSSVSNRRSGVPRQAAPCHRRVSSRPETAAGSRFVEYRDCDHNQYTPNCQSVFFEDTRSKSGISADSSEVSVAGRTFTDKALDAKSGTCNGSRSTLSATPASALSGVAFARPGAYPSSLAAAASRDSSPICSSNASVSSSSAPLKGVSASRNPPPFVGIAKGDCSRNVAAVGGNDAPAPGRSKDPDYAEGILLRKQRRNKVDVASHHSEDGREGFPATSEGKDGFSHAGHLIGGREAYRVHHSLQRSQGDSDAVVHHNTSARVDRPGETLLALGGNSGHEVSFRTPHAPCTPA